ncbi:hypothetical protein SELMODRAFT_444537 [Selaginella moellendorffii]|uniref:Uncharacterized protein n=1 Tax=Selaginella moellendorffii TaxID=88036 RepID=D8SAZ1_SELML|nr:hypothetical protein SELMODRAFT_444537 [Selaginella moellendorffii]
MIFWRLDLARVANGARPWRHRALRPGVQFQIQDAQAHCRSLEEHGRGSKKQSGNFVLPLKHAWSRSPTGTDVWQKKMFLGLNLYTSGTFISPKTHFFTYSWGIYPSETS